MCICFRVFAQITSNSISILVQQQTEFGKKATVYQLSRNITLMVKKYPQANDLLKIRISQYFRRRKIYKGAINDEQKKKETREHEIMVKYKRKDCSFGPKSRLYNKA